MSIAITPLGPTGLLNVSALAQPAPAAGSSDGPFGRVIGQMLGDINQQQAQSDQAVRQLALGETSELHNVMLSVAKADLSFHLFLEIRNRLSDAYQEVMRMQV